MTQQVFADMPTRLFSCTPSRLAAFDCPRRYRFAYVDRPTPPRGHAWAHSMLGAAVHVALARWWSLPRRARTPDEGERLVEREWQHAGFRDEAQSLRHRDLAAGWVRDYLSVHADPDVEPIGVERTISATTDTLAVHGRVDRIDERDGELVVVDYKTGRGGVSEGEARGSLALALYVLGARRVLRRACTRVELHHLPSGEIAAFEHSDESLARHVTRAEATAHDIRAATDTLAAGADVDEVFPPRPGPACSWCDFRAHCPEGQQSSTEREPWAGLAAP